MAQFDDLEAPIDHGTENPPEGVHAAVCCDIINLGPVESEFDGKKSTKTHIVIVWQVFPDRQLDWPHSQKDGTPFTFEMEYPLSLFAGNGSLNPARLYKDTVAWMGREYRTDEKFEAKKLLRQALFSGYLYEKRLSDTGGRFGHQALSG